MPAHSAIEERTVQVDAGYVRLEGTLGVPHNPNGVIVFAHGSGSSRFSARNRFVAEYLRDGGFATLLIDLLTPEEEAVDVYSREYRFDIGRLAERLVGATHWLAHERETERLSVGLFGASTGGGAALVAAAELPDRIGAVVSRGGRPDLAGPALGRVEAPTLLIVGGDDEQVIELNEQALRQLHATARLEIVPRATHLFDEPGALEKVAQLAREWFGKYLGANP